jgi:hypothetical protein
MSGIRADSRPPDMDPVDDRAHAATASDAITTNAARHQEGVEGPRGVLENMGDSSV